MKNATLITSLNSKAVADKLFEVFSKPKVIKNPIIQGNEKPGDVARVLNPYTLENETAFIKKMDMAISNLLVSTAEFLSGYTPSGVITGYRNRVLITSGTSWTVPAGVTEIRAVLVGGGAGGQAGFNGGIGMRGYETPVMNSQPEGTSPWYLSFNGEAGDGGNGGAAGAGGKIVDTGPLTVEPGTVMYVSIGSGGTGGASNGALGSAGGNTAFGPYSSANGEISGTGYVDTMTSALYGVQGYPGFKGQKGMGRIIYLHRMYTALYIKLTKAQDIIRCNRRTGYAGYPQWYSYYWGSPKKWSFAAGGGGGGGSYNGNVSGLDGTVLNSRKITINCFLMAVMVAMELLAVRLHPQVYMVVAVMVAMVVAAELAAVVHQTT